MSAASRLRTTRVLVVDDHLLSRKGICSILSHDPGFEVVGEAADGIEAVEFARALDPDLVLVDLRMPGLDGLEVTRKIKQRSPRVTVVVLSVSNDAQDFFASIRAGAQGYLMKDMEPDHWVGYLRAVICGNAPIPEEAVRAILGELSIGDDGASTGSVLSPREHQVLAGIATGLSNREIGESLFIAENTVKDHLANMLAKLGLRNRAQLVAYGYEHGWLCAKRRRLSEGGWTPFEPLADGL